MRRSPFLRQLTRRFASSMREVCRILHPGCTKPPSDRGFFRRK